MDRFKQKHIVSGFLKGAGSPTLAATSFFLLSRSLAPRRRSAFKPRPPIVHTYNLRSVRGREQQHISLVDTHFIERYKDDLLSISTKSSEEYHGVAELGAILAAACICKKDHITSKESQRMLDLPFVFFFQQ